MIMFWGPALFRASCALFYETSIDELNHAETSCEVVELDCQEFIAVLPAEEITEAPLSQTSAFLDAFAESKYKEEKRKYTGSLWGSFLYWQPKQDYMDVALRSPFVENNVASGFSFIEGTVIAVHPKYQPGFKVGGALGFNDTDWAIQAEYTQFSSTTSLARTSPKHGFLFAKWIQPNLIYNNASTWMQAKWDFDLYLGTLEISRSFLVGSKLELYPFLGVAGAWIDQKCSGAMDLRFPEVSLCVDDHSDSFGFGPRMGILAEWHFFSSFGLVSELAGQILYTSYDVSTQQVGTDNKTLFLDAKNHFSEVRPEFEMYMGLAYQVNLQRPVNWIRCDLGYDFQVWWNQNMIRWYNDITYVATPVGNLYLRGLRLSLAIGF